MSSFVCLSIGVVLGLAVGGGVARAQNGAALCGRIGSNQQLTECTMIVAGKRVDQAAVDVCGRIGSNQQIVGCARAVAGRVMPEGAVSLCGRIGSNQQIVECAAAVAGHTLERGAVDACGRIGSNQQIVECARAIADKSYAQEELDLCNRNGSNSGIVQCMLTTGRRRAPAYYPPTPPPPYNPNPYYAAPPPPPPPAPGYYNAPTATVTFDNLTPGETVVRFYYRPAGQRGAWSENVLRGALYPGQKTRLVVPQGQLDLCAELPDGTAGHWENRTVGPDGMNLWVEGDRNDPGKWAVRTPCRGRDRR